MYFSVISCRRTGVRMLTSSLVSLPQRRHIFIGIPTPLLRCSITGGDMTLSIPQLRDQLRRQQSDSAPRMQTMDTEVRLVLTLARGRRQEDQLEALERGESLWRELQRPSSPVPMTSRTGMRMTLCTALRRCAIVARQREVADVWTERFAQRHNITPEDFTTGPNHVPGEVLGWQQTRPRARPGTGIDEDDIKADHEEEEEERRRGSEKKSSQDNREELSPLQRFRHEVYMDHPMMQRAFKRGAEGPGPRYTGD